MSAYLPTTQISNGDLITICFESIESLKKFCEALARSQPKLNFINYANTSDGDLERHFANHSHEGKISTWPHIHFLASEYRKIEWDKLHD